MVAASRDFVCIRLATYESKVEAAFLVDLFRGRDGTLENSIFALLDPDGTTRLARTGRGPHFAFADSELLAAGMRKIAARYRGKAAVGAMPYLADLRRGLNVAACDIQPLVVVADDALEADVAKLAWSKDFVGTFAYAKAKPAELKAIGATAPGVYVVQPDAFGQNAKILAQATDAAGLKAAFAKGAAAFVAKEKDSRTHIRAGRRAGIHWETEIPVTDPNGPKRRGR